MKTNIKALNVNRIICKLSIALVIATLFSTTSCKDEDDKIDESVPDRMFRPVAFAAESTSTGTTFTWVPIAGAAAYYLEISKDSLLFTEDVHQITLNVSSSHHVTGLLSKSRYSARIKTISAKPEVLDSEFSSITFVIP